MHFCLDTKLMRSAFRLSYPKPSYNELSDKEVQKKLADLDLHCLPFKAYEFVSTTWIK